MKVKRLIRVIKNLNLSLSLYFYERYNFQLSLIPIHMYMKTLIIILIIAGITACKQQGSEPTVTGKAKTLKDTTLLNLQPIAEFIRYDVVIKNPDPADEWTETCLKGLDREKLIDEVYKAIYAGKVKAYDYYTDDPMSVKQVKEIEEQAESDGTEVAKVQFLEDWYLDPLTFNLYKKVHYIMLAYEILDENSNVRSYKAAFYVPFGLEDE